MWAHCSCMMKCVIILLFVCCVFWFSSSHVFLCALYLTTILRHSVSCDAKVTTELVGVGPDACIWGIDPPPCSDPTPDSTQETSEGVKEREGARALCCKMCMRCSLLPCLLNLL